VGGECLGSTIREGGGGEMGFPRWREAEEVANCIIFGIHKSAKRWDPARMGWEPRLDRMGNGK